MKKILLLMCVCCAFTACKKNVYTAALQEKVIEIDSKLSEENETFLYYQSKFDSISAVADEYNSFIQQRYLNEIRESLDRSNDLYDEREELVLEIIKNTHFYDSNKYDYDEDEE